MDGKVLARICDTECMKRGISKAEFYNAIGLTSASFHGWKNGSKPSQRYIDAIEKYFEIDLSEFERSETLDALRDDLRVLLRSAKELPPSSVYALVSQIEKMKEESV